MSVTMPAGEGPFTRGLVALSVDGPVPNEHSGERRHCRRAAHGGEAYPSAGDQLKRVRVAAGAGAPGRRPVSSGTALVAWRGAWWPRRTRLPLTRPAAARTSRSRWSCPATTRDGRSSARSRRSRRSGPTTSSLSTTRRPTTRWTWRGGCRSRVVWHPHNVGYGGTRRRVPGRAPERRGHRRHAPPGRAVRADADPGASSTRSCAARPTSCSARGSRAGHGPRRRDAALQVRREPRLDDGRERGAWGRT